MSTPAAAATDAQTHPRGEGASGRDCRSRWTLAAIGVVLLAAALRLCGIGRESLWLDEATSLMLARMPVREIAAWTALDLHPPLYYTLLRAWIHLGQSEAAVRGLSALASVLTVAVLCCLGCELFDRATGVTAALLLAVSPYAIWYAQEARMYAWLALLVTSAIWLALRALREGRWLAWVGYVLTSAAALYTHYYAFFGFGIANLLFLYVAVRRGAATRRLPARRVWLWLAAQAAVLVLFAPWLPNLLALVRGGSGGWLGRAASAPGIERLAHTLVYFMVGDTRVALPSLVRRAGYVLCVGAFLAGLWPWNRRARAGGALARDDGGRGGDVMDRPRLLEPREAVWFCLAWLILPLAGAWVASQVRPMYSERYMLPFLAPFLLLMARGVVRLPHKALGVTLATLLVALMLTGTVIQARSLDKPDWRGLAQSLRERARPDDLVLFVPGWHAKPFDYYAEGALDLCGDLPVPVPELRSEALEAVQQATMGRARVWLVWETPHYTDPDGLVRDYLATRLTQTANEPLPGVGRLLLFEREAE